MDEGTQQILEEINKSIVNDEAYIELLEGDIGLRQEMLDSMKHHVIAMHKVYRSLKENSDKRDAIER